MTTDRISYCSLHTKSTSHEQPVGTAAGFSRSVLIEIPLPWAKAALDSLQVSQGIKDALAEYREQVGEVNATLLVPDAGYAADAARVIDIRVENGMLTKRDVYARDGDIAAIIRTFARDEPLPPAAYADDTPWRDIIVCTHGSRDRCCGTFGFPLYTTLRARAHQLPNTRVWRSSHLGGHRFAPTLIDFPSGRSWGFVDESVADAILTPSAQPASLRPHYRGWVGYRDAGLQMLEAEALTSMGWQWNEYRKAGTVLTRDDQGRSVGVEIIATHPELPTVTFRGQIHWGEEFTTYASCHAAPDTYQRKALVELERIVHEHASNG